MTSLANYYLSADFLPRGCYYPDVCLRGKERGVGGGRGLASPRETLSVENGS